MFRRIQFLLVKDSTANKEDNDGKDDNYEDEEHDEKSNAEELAEQRFGKLFPPQLSS